MTRRFFLIAMAGAMAISVLWSCAGSAGGGHPSHNDTLAAQHAHADAMRAIQAPAGSMQREGAILHIRATEEAILQAGDTAAAAVYVDSAATLLRQAGLIY